MNMDKYNEYGMVDKLSRLSVASSRTFCLISSEASEAFVPCYFVPC